jgi:ribose 1,5-bisphosphokinase
VSEASAISASVPVRIGPGRLVLVVGPSGAGKDTLLSLACAACAGDSNVTFPHRVVTREASEAEDNAQVGVDAFQEAMARGEFAMHWEAHGHCYGVPRAIDDDIRAARTVVVNASRTVISEIRRAYVDVVVILVTAPPDVLAERLAMRARGSDGPIAQRLRRAVNEVVPDVTIVNVGAAEDHARRLIEIIKGV